MTEEQFIREGELRHPEPPRKLKTPKEVADFARWCIRSAARGLLDAGTARSLVLSCETLNKLQAYASGKLAFGSGGDYIRGNGVDDEMTPELEAELVERHKRCEEMLAQAEELRLAKEQEEAGRHLSAEGKVPVPLMMEQLPPAQEAEETDRAAGPDRGAATPERLPQLPARSEGGTGFLRVQF
jgi:hypothetical protein